MKTATEAIKTPEKGDRWEKVTESGRFTRRIVGKTYLWYGEWRVQYQRYEGASPNYRPLLSSLKSFRGWCQGAEYLGREK